MQLYLQFGYGMMGMSSQLIAEWGGGGGGGGVILSPRDQNESQLRRTAEAVRKAGGEVLLDPQCFSRDCDHKNLLAHDYWNEFCQHATASFAGGPATAAVLSKLAKLSSSVGVSAVILPGPIANPVSDDWFSFVENMIAEAPEHFGAADYFATVALSREALRDEVQVESVVEQAANWKIAGVYLVPEHPDGYLVADPNWLANLLILVSGIKLAKRRVIVGYSTHQMLCLAAADSDVIASGSWLNVRDFPLEKFYATGEEDVSRRALWYYCPQGLSEFKIEYLDIARRQGVLGHMAPPPEIQPNYAGPLFGGAAPSSVAWGETNAFKHYLTSLRFQAGTARQNTFEDTIAAHRSIIDVAEITLRGLRQNGVRGQVRDFAEICDVNRAALTVFETARGERMRRYWT
jgi:hypothetical protein